MVGLVFWDKTQLNQPVILSADSAYNGCGQDTGISRNKTVCEGN
jgi:hypothetical protein